MADEIYVNYRDKSQILDLVTDYPKATIILEIPLGQSDFTIKEALNYKTLTKEKIIFMLNDITLITPFIVNKIPYFLTYRARSFYELNALKDLGVQYAYIDAPAFFNMPAVQELGVPIRLTPQKANNTLLQHKDGVCGTWVRPEDIEYYDPCTIDLYMELPDKEQSLYNIYAVEQKWDGELGLIVEDLNYLGNNRLIGDQYITRRLTCGQSCQQNGRCRLCYTLLDLANPQKLREYRDEKSMTNET